MTNKNTKLSNLKIDIRDSGSRSYQSLLQSLSNFEINALVAWELGYKVQTEYDRFGFTEDYHELYPDTVWVGQCDDKGNQVQPWEQFCPTSKECAEALAIILDNRISIDQNPFNLQTRAMYFDTTGGKKVKCVAVVECEGDPLRSAMICFLIKQRHHGVSKLVADHKELSFVD